MKPSAENLLEKIFDEYCRKELAQKDNSGMNPAEREKRLARADKSELEFAKVYYPYIFSEPWNSLHRFIGGLESGKYTISGARKFGKSALVYVTKVIRRLALGGSGIINISLRTLDKSKERTASIIRLMTSSKKLVYDYNIRITQNRKGHYIVNNKHLIATSVMTGLRGITDDEFKRFEVSVNDDLYNKNTVTSDQDNEKVTGFITSEVYGQMEETGLCITLGNSISEDCPIRRLAEMNPGNHFSLPATDSDGKTNWPGHSLYDDNFWVTKQEEIPYDVWMGEYMDSPLRKGEIFQPEWIREININTIKIVTSLSALDPGTGVSAEACFKALATIGITESGQYVCLDIYIRKEGYPEVFDYVDNISRVFPMWKVLLFENDFNQWFSAKPWYENRVARSGRNIPIYLFSAKDLKTENYGSNKEQRIMNLVFPHQTGAFYYNEQIISNADFQRYRGQYLAFGKEKEKVDGLDALATAFIMSGRYRMNNSFKSLKNKQFR